MPDIPNVQCTQTFGQIQKVAFQRLRSSIGTRNSFTSEKAIGKLASWTPLLTADDDTKVVVSPYIQAPSMEGGDARTFGGGNDTLGGVEMVIGRNPSSFSSVMRQVPQNVVKALKQLQCESWADNLGVFLFDESGNIGALQDPETAGTYYPIPIRSLFVGDDILGGLEAPDSNALNWSFLPNWSDDLAMVAPEDFNPLSDLLNGTAEA